VGQIAEPFGVVLVCVHDSVFGEFVNNGLVGGYVIPLGRKKWGNLEFSLAAGILRTDYRHYLPTESYDKLIRDRYNVGKATYFGPTKAKVSLVIPINIPNRLARKEVSR